MPPPWRSARRKCIYITSLVVADRMAQAGYYVLTTDGQVRDNGGNIIGTNGLAIQESCVGLLHELNMQIDIALLRRHSQ